jgi:ubiquinone/menaquinone biosynthesis C-methylase UbiE
MDNAVEASNLDPRTVKGFGLEWSKFDQSATPEEELLRYFDAYFSIFPWETLPPEAEGMDVGCGSGRWARFVSERVGRLHCVDASADALAVARRNLASQTNCTFHHASVDNIELPDDSLDFGYSLGVLHHVPDTTGGLTACVAKLKPGAPFLVYLYYAFDNRPRWFRAMWRASNRLRQVISRLPDRARLAVAEAIASTVYLPLARMASVAEKWGAPVDLLPLSYYRNASLYTMRTDALDRFGTRLEQRFSADDIRAMMTAAGLEDIRFRDAAPYWCAVGRKARKTT